MYQPPADAPPEIAEHEGAHDVGGEVPPTMSRTFDTDEEEQKFEKFLERAILTATGALDYDELYRRFKAGRAKRGRKAARQKERREFEQRAGKPPETSWLPKNLNTADRRALMKNAKQTVVELHWRDIAEDAKEESKAERRQRKQKEALELFYKSEPGKQWLSQEAIRKIRPEEFVKGITQLEQEDARNKPTRNRAKGRTGALAPDHADRESPGGTAITSEPTGEFSQQQAIERYNGQQADPELQIVPAKHRTRRRWRLSTLVGGKAPAGVFKNLNEAPALHRDLWLAHKVGKGCPATLLARLIQMIGEPVTTEGARRAAFIAIVAAIAKRDGLRDQQIDRRQDSWWAMAVLSYTRERSTADVHVRALGEYSTGLGEKYLAELRASESGS
jgi:hypothetical protein